MKLGEKIKLVRKHRGLTPRELGESPFTENVKGLFLCMKAYGVSGPCASSVLSDSESTGMNRLTKLPLPRPRR